MGSRVDEAGTILVVDDEDLVLGVTERMLRRAGYEVLKALGGRRGVAVFSEHRDDVDAVVLDLAMPDMDGQATFHEIRRICSDVPVVFYSGHAGEGGGQVVADEPGTAFLSKPFSIAALDEKIRTTCGPRLAMNLGSVSRR